MSYSVWAAITEYHALGSLNKQTNKNTIISDSSGG